jgi:hypothetical protein
MKMSITVDEFHDEVFGRGVKKACTIYQWMNSMMKFSLGVSKMHVQ